MTSIWRGTLCILFYTISDGVTRSGNLHLDMSHTKILAEFGGWVKNTVKSVGQTIELCRTERVARVEFNIGFMLRVRM